MTHLRRSQIKSRPHYAVRMAAARTLAYGILLVWCLLSLYPMGLMVVNSFKSDDEMHINPAGLPVEWTWQSYESIFRYHGGLWRNFVVSAVVTVSATVISVFLSAMAAFAFAKYHFKGRELIFALLLATMMVPPEITIPGLYLVFARLRWLNTLQALILPATTSVLGLFLIRQYMLEIPDALIEAARIDGAGHLQVFWKIMVPTSIPVLGAFSILRFMGVWNQYLWPALAVAKRELQPIMVVLPQLVDPKIGFLPVWGTIMAGCTLSVLPILVVFIAFQDTFISSVVIGAVKE
jgi:ABC-type glycerol-3-phosphate transport system permease component